MLVPLKSHALKPWPQGDGWVGTWKSEDTVRRHRENTSRRHLPRHQVYRHLDTGRGASRMLRNPFCIVYKGFGWWCSVQESEWSEQYLPNLISYHTSSCMFMVILLPTTHPSSFTSTKHMSSFQNDLRRPYSSFKAHLGWHLQIPRRSSQVPPRHPAIILNARVGTHKPSQTASLNISSHVVFA